MTNAFKSGRSALVLGATGGIGGHVARGLLARGWRVKALNRSVEAARSRETRFDWVVGDAMNAEDVAAAAEGVDLIVHAVNPPGYRNWNRLVLPMLDNTIAAARRNGARILLPGTVYNFGPDAFPILTEESPQNPQSRKGGIRVVMEERLRAAAEQGVPVLIVRAGDYFGPGAANSWFSQALVKPGRPVASVLRPNAEGVGHQWAYLPDVAETMLRLIDQVDRLPIFARFHMKGFWDDDGEEMIAAIGRVVGAAPKEAMFPWWIMRLASPFVPLFGELSEMRYLWRQPIMMPNDRLVAFLGEEPSTPIDEAVRVTLADLGCLPAHHPVSGDMTGLAA
jgi:nucleoside-diphosphate-sugar epimerase